LVPQNPPHVGNLARPLQIRSGFQDAGVDLSDLLSHELMAELLRKADAAVRPQPIPQSLIFCELAQGLREFVD
jgi:hypothetical protein